MSNRAKLLILLALVIAIRLPFLNQAIQGDDPYYLYGAEHAQIDPLHPLDVKYLFQGDLVDMRGHPHGPLNSWILAAPLAVIGDVREPLFHFRYILWSLIAMIAMWSLAKRFCDQPFWACLLFLAVPAFFVNGNSLEADLPFLAMFLSSVALFVRGSIAWSAVFGALAGLAAYQAVLLVPILVAFCLVERWRSVGKVLAIFAAPVAIVFWQLFERLTRGEWPAAVLLNYMKTYGLQSPSNKLHNIAALAIHLCWIVSPLIGVFILAKWRKLDFVAWWILIFFTGAALIFFAGSARYLLPIAAPICILAARTTPRPILAIGFALQMMLSTALATVNYQHWDAYRKFANDLQTNGHRVWINAEWGLRWYLEQKGGVEMARDQFLYPGDIVVSSELALPLPVNAPLAPISNVEISPSIPLRLISLDGKSAYSSASSGLWPFEISHAPIDRVHAQMVVERHPQLIWISPKDSAAAEQMISGISADGWMGKSATFLLKMPDHPMPLRAEVYVLPVCAARHIEMLIDGQPVGEAAFSKPGSYAIAIPPVDKKGAITVTLNVDATFSVPGDARALGVLVTGVGFR